MITNELTKHIKLYTPHFEDLCLSIYGDYRLQRLSMDMDAILFRSEYMLNHDIDLDKIDNLKNEYAELNQKFCKTFSEIALAIITNKNVAGKHIKKINDIKDILVSDIEMGPEYVSFKVYLYSDNEDMMYKIDNAIPDDGKVYNLFPNKFFRFKVDSYNDGVAKAYPELFEKRSQNVIGTGNDADVFCHSVTLQVGERCSLNCTYCFGEDTFITMDNGTVKRIKDIQVGDYVLGFSENIRKNKVGEIEASFEPAQVMYIHKHEASVWKLSHPYIDDTYLTPDHKILKHNGVFDEISKFSYVKDGIMRLSHRKAIPMYCYSIERKPKIMTVYNLTTETGTYVANTMLVHNCYQFNKSEMRMSFDTAKTFIDNLLEDKYGYVNQYNSPAIILEFIGGEPLMEINLITEVYEYFLKRCYELNHPYFTMHRLSICSNGMQYFDEPVQEFFRKYSNRISFNISIDGNKELHDSCRIQPNGEGSYDIDIAALAHYNENYSKERNSKMTLAPNNIKYLCDSVKSFIDTGTSVINVNCVFEEGWTKEHAGIYYHELLKLADYIIDNKLENIFISVFRETPDGPIPKHNDSTTCGGTGAMLAVRPNGDLYPCLRYMPSSVGDNVKDLKMGNVHDGMIGREEKSEVLSMLDKITRRSYTNDICFNCKIANACMTCAALGHTVYGTPGKRTTFTCDMVKAEHLANVYFWNKLASLHPEYKIPVRKIQIWKYDALSFIPEADYIKLEEIVITATIATMNKVSSKNK